ncbi:MAG: hypothetical protein JWP59_617 [Massilia sp.]|nr:hypothetical protein [Massilia sp.]
MKLKPEDIALLRMLDREDAAAPLTDAPKFMFEFNLVSRLPSGVLQLTKTGARAVFQAACIDALDQAGAGLARHMENDVERWLTSSGFLQASDKTVTARGKLWLESLSPDAAAGTAAADAAGRAGSDDAAGNGAEFAARRNAA